MILRTCLYGLIIFWKNKLLLSIIIKNLEKNVEKQNFAKQGRKIHSRKRGERCAFCGNEISPDRWELLDQFFNDASDEFDRKIRAEIVSIGKIKKEIASLKTLDTGLYYNIFTNDVSKINNEIINWQKQALILLDEIESKLIEKKEKTNSSLTAFTVQLPDSYKDIQKTIDELNGKQTGFTINLDQEKNKAKEKVRFNLISKLKNSKELSDMNLAKKMLMKVLSH
ncbi:AAA family ATPase [Fructobacillus parabroussonetiae]|uniref:AAA family ATPase n=1 Tax=Fructobacillus parabroussonetiae TaxID=2713174 RepID=UPI00200B170E|nr:AAA family ATPase [Fructobacillus parabroussonetiae]